MRFSSAKAGAGVVLHALQVGADLPRLLAEFLLLLVGARRVGALLEVDRLLVEAAHAVDRLVDAVDQALALGVGEAQPADDARDHDLLASQRPAAAAMVLRPLLLRDACQLLHQLDRLLVVTCCSSSILPGDVVQAIGHHLFGDLLFVEENDFLDGAHPALQVFADGDDLANDDGRARQRLQHAQLAALDALGDFNFAFAREQRNRAHLAQIHADRIVGFLQSARARDRVPCPRRLRSRRISCRPDLGPLEHINALRADGGQQVLEVVGRMHVVRDQIVHLVIGEITLLFSHIDQFFDIVVLVF